MKTRNLAVCLSIALMLSMSPFAQAFDKAGNGGGGVMRDGKYMTFYSAGLYVEPTGNGDQRSTKIPGLNELVQYVKDLKYIGYDARGKLLNAIIPMSDRQYYFADPKELTPEIRARLLEEFSRVTGVDPRSIRLFALTDTYSRTTFLLPEFSQLSKNDQMTILFHEAYWILNPSASYNQVVQAEMAFQAALSEPNDPARMLDFVKKLGMASEEGILEAEINLDIESGSLNGLLQKDSVGEYLPLGQIFTPEVTQCQQGELYTQSPSYSRIGFNLKKECQPLLIYSLYSLSTRFPQSGVLNRILKKVQADSFLIRLSNPLTTQAFFSLAMSDLPKMCKLYLRGTDKDANFVCNYSGTAQKWRSNVFGVYGLVDEKYTTVLSGPFRF